MNFARSHVLTKMNRIFVTDIYANIDYNGYECLASIDNYSSLREKIAIGENIASNEFKMIFPNSIGESKWRLLFYPKGQYVGERVGDSIGIYLVMLSCEQECKLLNANVAFQLKSQTDCYEPVKKVNTIFNYSIPTKRWIGEPDFLQLNWLNGKRRRQFCANDSLTIRCCVEETKSEDTESDDVLSLLNDPLERTSLLSKSLERTLTTADNKTNGDEIQIKMECNNSDDRKNNNDLDWSTVNSRKGKKTQPINRCNASSNTNSSKQKNKRQGNRKKSSNRGGKRKK